MILISTISLNFQSAGTSLMGDGTFFKVKKCRSEERSPEEKKCDEN